MPKEPKNVAAKVAKKLAKQILKHPGEAGGTDFQQDFLPTNVSELAGTAHTIMKPARAARVIGSRLLSGEIARQRAAVGATDETVSVPDEDRKSFLKDLAKRTDHDTLDLGGSELSPANTAYAQSVAHAMDLNEQAEAHHAAVLAQRDADRQKALERVAAKDREYSQGRMSATTDALAMNFDHRSKSGKPNNWGKYDATHPNR